jgi:uncharacterized protein (TIGR02266 family)
MLKIEYQSMDSIAVDFLLDLSEGGLFIRTDLDFNLGDEIEFTLSFPGLLKPIPLKGVVRRINESKENRGVGVEFVFEDDETRDMIQKLVKTFYNKEDQAEEEDDDHRASYKVLIVDDNQLVLELFTHALTKMVKKIKPGHKNPQIITASDGIKALQILHRERVDFVILDNYMPGMDGISVLRALREDPKFIDLPVIMISVGKEDIKLDSLRSGANLFVAKPVQAQHLLTTLTSLLKNEGMLPTD